MDNEKRKLDVTGIIGMITSILSVICISISFFSYIGIRIFNLPIESIIIIIFMIIAISLGIIGIIVGYDGRKRWSLGQSVDGNISGTSAMVLGFVTIGVAALFILAINIQGGSELLIKSRPAVDPALIEKDLKEKTAKTTEQVSLLLKNARGYAPYMEEDSVPPAIEKFAARYKLEPKDAWGNDIILKFEKKMDESGYFLQWTADVSSAGPDGNPGTADDIRPETK